MLPYHATTSGLSSNISAHSLWFHLSRQHIPLDPKHLPSHSGRIAIHLSRILLHLPRIEHNLQPVRLLRQLEQLRPLLLRQRGLFRQRPRDVLRFPFRLPCVDFVLLASQLALIVLIVVEFGVVGLDAVEEEIAGLFQEGIDGEVEGVEVRVERGAGVVGEVRGYVGEVVGKGWWVCERLGRELV